MNAASTTVQPTQEASLFVGENLDVVIPPDRLYGHSDEFCLRNLCRRNSSAVCKLATPYDPALSTMAGELARKDAADLETCLSMAAQRRGPYATYGDKTYYNYPPRAKRGVKSLDDWAMDILKKKPKLISLEDDSVAPSYEAFFLFVVRHVKAHISGVDATGLKSEDCRLILPMAKHDTDDDNTNVYVVGRDDPTEFSNVECGLFPLSSGVERQTMSASHLIVANVEIVRHLDDFNEAEPKLVRKTKELFPNQHNRRFAWGLAASCHTIYAYVFVDRLGFDPTIRYVVDGNTGGTYLEIDVYETGKCAGQMEKRTYYSKRCIRVAETFTGRRGRYFAASASPEMLNTPEFLVKDMWAILTSGSTSDTRESSFLNYIYDGQCLVFSNTLLYKMPKFMRVDATKPGHCKMLTFYFVDPSTRIPSTEIVPPQQVEWWSEEVRSCEPFRSLPLLIVDKILNILDDEAPDHILYLDGALDFRDDMVSEVWYIQAEALPEIVESNSLFMAYIKIFTA
ncbi:hypothetical protein GGI03_001347 [Coemansia sp. RSA 2337]|nr:hypothetical protein GGI03_001347 [Coemansia sp. RSA 2337]